MLSHVLRSAVFTALAVSIATPSIAQDTSPGEADRRAAMQAYYDCRLEKANLLDDGVSDALTIGNAVAAACRVEMELMADVLSAGEGSRVRSMLISRLERRSAEDTAVIVLRQRSRRSEDARRTSPVTTARQPEAGSGSEVAEREQLTKGVHLKAACEAAGDEWSKCSAFIRGVMTAYAAGVIDGGGSPPYCPPERYFAYQWTTDVVDFLDSHPEMTQQPAAFAVVRALTSTYPCER